MSVKGTEFTIRDAAGNALCHSAGARKSALNSRVRRNVTEAFSAMVKAAGMIDAAGMWTCAVSGAVAVRNSPDADASLVRAGMVVDAGHVIADERDGAFCPCNLVPELRALNLTHGSRDIDAIRRDPRVMWRAVWEASASQSKRNRAV